MIKRFTIISLMLFPVVLAMGQEDKEHLFRTDTVEFIRDVQILGLPLLFYTPETSFGAGLGGQIFFNNRRNLYNNRVSNLFVTGIYTVNKQLSVTLTPQFYFFDGLMYLEGEFLYRIYPNSFWGLGGDTPEAAEERYNMKTLSARVSLVNRIPPSLNFGFEYEYEKHEMLEVEEGGLLDAGDIAGSEGARTSGLSFILDYDTRDNIYSTVGGAYLIFKGGFSAKTFGATHAFNRYLIDLRKYFILADKHTLAIQSYFESASGNVPFQSMSWLGGPNRNRGFFNGRYMDNLYLVFQAELRLRIVKRLNVNGFLSVGQVSQSSERFFNYPKTSGGVGVRYQILKSNPTLIRLDFGVNQYGDSGVYFGVNEVF